MGTPEPARAAGPDVRLVGIYPADGQGVECVESAADDCGVPTNATLTLRFDRFLNPATVNRQAIQVFTGDPARSPAIPFDVVYDPVERVARFHMPGGYGFMPRTLYQLRLLAPKPGDELGIRAFDGAPLAEGELPLEVSFYTSNAPVAQPVGTAPTCHDIVTQVLDFPRLGNCASQECHAATNNALGAAPAGLWLDGRYNLRVTAVGRVARGTELGDASGVPLQNAPRFGVQMPLIDPKNPGNSYLLYKLLRLEKNFDPCPPDTPSSVCDLPADPGVSAYPELPLGEGESLVPSAQESERLREWFVRGEPMPLQRGGARSVSLQGLRAISAFIAAGADCTQ